MRDYGRFFSFLPAKAGRRSEYRIRIPYGFYGTLPSASHSNLSLIGEGLFLRFITLYSLHISHHFVFLQTWKGYKKYGGRWEQLAIGASGEVSLVSQ